MAESKDKDHISARDSNKSSKYTSAKIPSSREQYSNEKYSEDHPRHTNHSNSLDRHPVVKTTSAYTSAMSTGSHSNRSTPVATNPSVSPAGSLQDVSPPSTPSSRPSVYDANVHTASPQLISLSPHPTQFTPTQSPQLLQQHLQRHMPAQVSYPVTQGTVSSTQLHNMQSSYTQYGLVNNGNQEHENCTAQPSISQQSQKNHYEVLAAQPALHPLQQATLLHQRQLTEAKHSTMPHHYASQSVSTQMSTSAIAWEDNRASNSGSPGLLPHTSATSKEQLPGLSGTHMPQISVQASSSPYGSLSSQPSPTVNLQALNKFVDKSLTNHVVGWVTEGAEKQIQRLSEEGSSNANDANKTIIEQFQLHSQLNLLELRLDLGTKRLASLKEVTKTLEFLLAESDKKSLT
ncbi:predicted protein [Nematostella vectensis]|uniref:Uncharacterized protein n=2 Tax=Nematostella vectensis TaxID=45351 RepID=A7ST93_NEMVE|nr:predicted protein [Nematostella vectensis]|eukprot:XP_001625173.1 predicted protein [Nematostella vectensis]